MALAAVMEIQRQATAGKLPGPESEQSRAADDGARLYAALSYGQRRSGRCRQQSSRAAGPRVQRHRRYRPAQRGVFGQRLCDQVEEVQYFGEAIGHFFVTGRDAGCPRRTRRAEAQGRPPPLHGAAENGLNKSVASAAAEGRSDAAEVRSAR
jgi:hypothetical protein